MNHDKENKASNRTLAVGWFDNAPFRAICGKYVSRIKEVFFAWPGVTASRPMAEWTPERKQLFFEDIAWANWIRPEELPEYERIASVVKLATRRHPDPEGVIRAYATYSYDGDLAKIMDPFFDFPVPIDNAALGKSALWPVIRDCPDAHNCRRCGKCDALIDELAHRAGGLGESAVVQTFAGFFKG